jgi:phospholipid transport system transporter-binding protein
LKTPELHGAAFEAPAGERARVVGLLEFGTVAALLPLGSAAICEDRAPVIDLAAVTGSDSAGLALLIEWLSVAKAAGRSLRYENIPSQLHQLAGLSEIDSLISGA